VVASAFVIMFVTFGAAYSFTVFFASVQQAFAASRGEVSLAFSIAVPLFYLTGAVSGPLADRFGARAVCLFGIAMGGSGLVLAGAATTLWQIYIGFGLGLGLGIGFRGLWIVHDSDCHRRGMRRDCCRFADSGSGADSALPGMTLPSVIHSAIRNETERREKDVSRWKLLLRRGQAGGHRCTGRHGLLSL
jgi:MFS family permease